VVTMVAAGATFPRPAAPIAPRGREGAGTRPPGGAAADGIFSGTPSGRPRHPDNPCEGDGRAGRSEGFTAADRTVGLLKASKRWAEHHDRTHTKPGPLDDVAGGGGSGKPGTERDRVRPADAPRGVRRIGPGPRFWPSGHVSRLPGAPGLEWPSPTRPWLPWRARLPWPPRRARFPVPWRWLRWRLRRRVRRLWRVRRLRRQLRGRWLRRRRWLLRGR
jgi:hypothetical protein